MTALREGLPPLPNHMRHLKISAKGYPVPHFVKWFNGHPDFRVVDEPKIVPAVKKRLCWICGEPLGKNMAFVIGPMSAISRISSEPPSHRDCTLFAVQACPFMILPQAKRRLANMPTDRVEPPGNFIETNPGVMMVWVTQSYTVFKQGRGVLFQVGDPTETQWYAQGRAATRAEVEASIEAGLPAMMEPAQKQSLEAVHQVHVALADLQKLLPA